MKTSLTSLLLACAAAVVCSTALAAPKQPSLLARLAPGQSCVPAWPDGVVGKGQGGTTRLKLRVGPQGEVLSAQVTGSSGFADLDQATLAAATACKFVPGSRSGLPAVSSVVFTHVWERARSVYTKDVPAGTRAAARKPCAALRYPAASLQNGEQGTVHLRFVIGADGAVLDKKIVQSSGFEALDQAALEGLAQCEFSPAFSHGKAEQSELPYSYKWTLE